MAQQWVKASVGRNGIAIITLDRPKALNAMNLEMDITYKQHLDEWATLSTVRCVLVESSSSRAFCAGMDVKGLAAAVQEDIASSLPHQVFGAEYSLICSIARYKKPYISFMDGITMGFGLGLCGHGCYRVVTERTVLAMPENAIGLFPDVGFARLVAESPGNGAVGAYLALTGSRINNPADALFVGLATHFVPSNRLPSLRAALLQLDLPGDAHAAIESVLLEYSDCPDGEPKLQHLLPSIVHCFGGGKSVLESIEALKIEQQSDDRLVKDWAKAALDSIGKGGPFSLVVTQKHFSAVASAASKYGHPLSEVEGVMRTEYYLGIKTSIRGDFVEGVRAVLVDKDQKPRWQPGTLADVDTEDVEGVFRPLDGHPVPF